MRSSAPPPTNKMRSCRASFVCSRIVMQVILPLTFVMVLTPPSRFGVALAACVCDTNLTLNASLYDLRVSLKKTSIWASSVSACTWPGVTCGDSLTGLSLCSSSSYPCGSGATLPSSNSTWSALGAALTTIAIGNYAPISGSFPLAASTSLTMITSVAFNFFSPTGSTQLPSGSPTGYAMTLYSSVITITGSSAARLTSISVSYTTFPEVSGIVALKNILLYSTTLGTLSWTGMTNLVSVRISYSVSVLPSWSGSDAPALSSIVLYALDSNMLPESWSTLTMLTSISISLCSSLTSTIPSSWSSMVSLQSLSIASTPIAGPLPDTWGSLTRLTSIAISGASFATATLPPSWTNITSLKSLVILSSALGGPLPEWESSTSITTISLTSNSIIGPLPTTIVGWGNLTTLDLSNNPLNTSLPEWSTLTTFTCTSCKLIGPLPSWGLGTNRMKTLSISGNSFGSSIPASWGNMSTLQTLVAASSNITGDLPQSWSPSVVSLDLRNNRIGSSCNFTVPPSLRMLALNDNLCTGQHPVWTSATSLTMIDLSGNSFSGTLANIPSALQTLRVDRGNTFSGLLPSWATSSSLSIVAANNNRFTGTVPAFASNARIATLQLAGSNLSGTIPTSSSFAYLQYLDLSSNAFNGTLPSLSSASGLVEFNISFNNFTGSITLLSTIGGLTLFDVSCNSLTGPLPSWGSSGNLKYVNVTCGNAFTGTLPTFGSGVYSKLISIDATDQKLTGTLSSILGSLFVTSPTGVVATAMLLGGNALTGTLPPFLTWPTIQRFNVSGSSLTGSLVMSGGVFPAALWSIDVSSNSGLSGAIAVPTATSFAALQHLLLGGDAHNFSGALPPLHTKFPSLTRFSLSGSFNVTLPYAWLVGSAAWVNLTTLSLRKCGFSGTFPSPLASAQLTLLDLSANQLGGTLVDNLTFIAAPVTTLNVSANSFRGAISSLSLPLSLIEFYASGNNLNGPFSTTCVMNSSTLQVLDLSLNNLSGPLDESLAECFPQLTGLDLSNNNFSCSMPSWTNLTLLAQLSLRSCSLSGTLPADLPTSLQVLLLYNNSISSSTTDASLWESLANLVRLDISSNNFTDIPLFPITQPLAFLNVSDNQYNTALPASWANLSRLATLNASNSGLYGSIPVEWTSGPLGAALRDLDLSGNSMGGVLTQLPRLLNGSYFPLITTLRLRGANMSGSIANLSIASSLTDVDLSSNLISGTLTPLFLTSATRLATLQLQGNQLRGSLYKVWGLPSTLPAMRLLNLSSNSVSGRLPYNWGNLFLRATVDLCGNNFCSPIPKTLNTVPNFGFARCNWSIPQASAVDCVITVSDSISSSHSASTTALASKTASYSSEDTKTTSDSSSRSRTGVILTVSETYPNASHTSSLLLTPTPKSFSVSPTFSLSSMSHSASTTRTGTASVPTQSLRFSVSASLSKLHATLSVAATPTRNTTTMTHTFHRNSTTQSGLATLSKATMTATRNATPTSNISLTHSRNSDSKSKSSTPSRAALSLSGSLSVTTTQTLPPSTTLSITTSETHSHSLTIERTISRRTGTLTYSYPNESRTVSPTATLTETSSTSPTASLTKSISKSHPTLSLINTPSINTWALSHSYNRHSMSHSLVSTLSKQTASDTRSATTSAPESMSSSLCATATHTLLPSLSLSVTATAAQSGTSSSALSASKRTPTLTLSFPNVSLTLSLLITPTNSPSRSVTFSVSSSTSQEPSATRTGTLSNPTMSLPLSISHTLSKSLPTLSLIITASCNTWAITQTFYRNSRSQSASVTLTKGSKSATQSSAQSSSVTVTHSRNSATRSKSSTASGVISASASIRRSATPTIFISATAGTFSASMSPSATLSVRGLSQSASSGNTLSSSVTAEHTETVSPTLTHELAITHTVPSASWSASMSVNSNTSVMTESASTSSTSSATRSLFSASSEFTVTSSISQWDCNAVNNSEIFIGLGNVSVRETANSSVRFVALAPALPPTNPTIMRGASVPKAVTTTSKPVDRHQLMDAPTALVLSVLVDSPFAGNWAVAGVTLAGVPLQWQSNRSVTGDIHLITLQPPDIGWVGLGGLPLFFADRVLHFEVTMACGYSPFLVMGITVVSPKIPRELAEEVKSATQSSQIAAALVGSASPGASLARASTVRSMVLCDADSAASGSMMDIDFHICNREADSEAVVTSRNSVLSSLILLVAVGTVLLLCSVLWATLRKEPIGNAAATFGLPSVLMPVFTTVVPNMASGSAMIAARLSKSSCIAVDAALVTAAALVLASPPVLITVLWASQARGTAPRWICAPVTYQQPVDGRGIIGILQGALRKGVERRWKWFPAAQPSLGTPQWTKVLLLEYRVLWYAAVDGVLLVVMALLAVVGGLDSTDVSRCQKSTGAVVILLLLQFALVAVVQPFTSLFSRVAALTSIALTCASVVAQLVVTVSTDASVLWLSTASLGCVLAIVGVSACKMLLDAYDFANGVRKRFRVVMGKSAPPRRPLQVRPPVHDAKDAEGRSASTPSDQIDQRAAIDCAAELLWIDDLMDEAADPPSSDTLFDEFFNDLLAANVEMPEEDDEDHLIIVTSLASEYVPEPEASVAPRLSPVMAVIGSEHIEGSFWDASGQALKVTTTALSNEEVIAEELLLRPIDTNCSRPTVDECDNENNDLDGQMNYRRKRSRSRRGR